MSDHAHFVIELYSPRYGTHDPYEFTLDRNQMKISHIPAGQATCTWQEGRDPVWSGGGLPPKHPLLEIIENEEIYPPTIFVDATEYAWQAWRRNELNDEEIQTELAALFAWVDETTKYKPNTEFWRKFMS